ncbi:kynureninase [Lacisediminihabitans changchengi]|uniref:Kynureninase n=1 Tax=Lacisediminihabitans changchengi TaxID=2787634 RepID=A0A934SKL5_9MICO|nr:aminotransferase class V-fold PLP-dependent enzyme [Lacisediminihabitans changchengi]MBK4347051.1 aminotransferase class V-fold PLP-dependent enzyme [Lacisediminihabitans changchengi]MBK4347826.1 aminotransferase class V-fold PLP-dependent enzyme [Lacisediminihabitans changchengi]
MTISISSSKHDSAALDAADPLAAYVDLFVPGEHVVSYLDGNSLGRPLLATRARFDDFIVGDWGNRLIRSWDEQWMSLPLDLGDRIAAITLGAAAGQTVVADSTTVMLYKFVRAAVDARLASSDASRSEIVVDVANFPTDRYLVEGIAAERGLTLRWIEVDPDRGVTVEQVTDVVGDRTALVLLSHVDYRSGYVADIPAITAVAHEAGALVLWDLCHSAGVIPMQLDEWGVDLAVGCSYKYLNGGPGAPAFGYVAARLQGELVQPIQGWMGAADVFAMGPGYRPAEGMRRFISGTPPVVGMLAMQDMLDAIESAGIEAIRAKSLALTSHAFDLVEELLSEFGVGVVTPREEARRGSHVTITHPEFRAVTQTLWAQDVIPDFRNPDGIRLGLSPLSTSFAELRVGVEAIRTALLALR